MQYYTDVPNPTGALLASTRKSSSVIPVLIDRPGAVDAVVPEKTKPRPTKSRPGPIPNGLGGTWGLGEAARRFPKLGMPAVLRQCHSLSRGLTLSEKSS